MRKLSTFLHQSGIFSGIVNIAKYTYLKLSPVALPKILSVRLKSLDFSLLCRPKSTDIGTLISVFDRGYHLPPADLPENAVILDLGVNVGYTVIDLARRYPTARIIGLEMDRENFEIAFKNVQPYGSRCTLLHAAVWTEDGEVSYEGQTTDSFHISSDGGESAVTVRARSIGSLMSEYNLDRIDYIKMDIEGAEQELIELAEEWAPKVGMMNIEAHSSEIFEFIQEKLGKLGFDCTPSKSHWMSVFAVRRE
jgi:FkbM family methyltransferase